MVFGIHGANDELLESYHFKFDFKAGGASSIEVTRQSVEAGAAQEDVHSCTKEEAKFQTVQLLRSLILLTQSLTPLPDIRYVSMKLWYYDTEVPEDYEPPNFRAANREELLRFTEVPMVCNIGKLGTGFHDLLIKLKTTAEDEMQVASQLSVQPTVPTDCEMGTSQAEPRQVNDAMAVPPTKNSAVCRTAAADDDALKKYVRETGICSIAKLLSLLPDSNEETVRCALNSLAEEGFLKIDTKGRYRLACRAGEESTPSDDPQLLRDADILFMQAVDFATGQAILKKDILKSALGVEDASLLNALMQRLMSEGVIEKYCRKQNGWPVQPLEEREKRRKFCAEGRLSLAGPAFTASGDKKRRKCQR